MIVNPTEFYKIARIPRSTVYRLLDTNVLFLTKRINRRVSQMNLEENLMRLKWPSKDIAEVVDKLRKERGMVV